MNVQGKVRVCQALLGDIVEGVQSVCPDNLDLWCRNLALHTRLGENTEKCTKWNGEQNVGYNVERTRKQKWAWPGHVIRRTDSIWTTKVIEWQLRNCSSQGGKETGGETRLEYLSGIGWSRLASNRER